MGRPEQEPGDTTTLPGVPARWDRVWVWVFGAWHPGLVLDATEGGALVRYRTGHDLIDTVPLVYVAARHDPDDLDREIPPRPPPLRRRG